MNSDCFEFRSRLSAALAQTPTVNVDNQVQSLGWHEHLLHCGACRQLLEDEQALDQLLGTLPRPSLPEPQRQDLLVRLGENLALERLLDAADVFDHAPVGLCERVSSYVEESVHGLALDRQLDRVAPIQAPAGMNTRILAHCKYSAEIAPTEGPTVGPRAGSTARRAKSAPSGGPRSRRAWRHWASASLAAVAVALVLWYLPAINPGDNTTVATPDKRTSPTDPSDSGADAELLAMLDNLEIMDLVDELDGEEWALLDDYDRLGLFLVEDGSPESESSGETPR